MYGISISARERIGSCIENVSLQKGAEGDDGYYFSRDRMLSAIEQPWILNIQTKHFVGKMSNRCICLLAFFNYCR